MDIFADVHLSEVISTLIYCGIGFLFFVVAYFLMELIMPFPVRKEIEEDQNIALGVIIGCMIIGLAIIIASAIVSPTSEKDDSQATLIPAAIQQTQQR